MILGILGILVLGAVYGYWIGTVGKRHSWSGKKVKGVAGFPLMVPFNGWAEGRYPLRSTGRSRLIRERAAFILS
jgi:hypothetical protein